eukprot:1923089-Ditylum_brightwellii.AAC.1
MSYHHLYSILTVEEQHIQTFTRKNVSSSKKILVITMESLGKVCEQLGSDFDEEVDYSVLNDKTAEEQIESQDIAQHAMMTGSTQTCRNT